MKLPFQETVPYHPESVAVEAVPAPQSKTPSIAVSTGWDENIPLYPGWEVRVVKLSLFALFRNALLVVLLYIRYKWYTYSKDHLGEVTQKHNALAINTIAKFIDTLSPGPGCTGPEGDNHL